MILLLLACTGDKAADPVVYKCLAYTADCSDTRSCWLVTDERAYMDEARAYLEQDNAAIWTDATRSGYTDASGTYLCASCPEGYQTLGVVICSPVN